MIKPFHLSFVVPDLLKAKEFYIDVIGCDLGRDTGEWIDIIFFGHQVTMHQERDGMLAKSIDHFGPVLAKTEWQFVSKKLMSNSVHFELPPTVKFEGTDKETGKYIVKDPAGNLLEFKYYHSFSSTIQAQNA
jgi:extradiol dioxygenase family protein